MEHSAATPITTMDEEESIILGGEGEMSVDGPQPRKTPVDRSSHLVTKDTKLVNRSKCVVYVVLLLSAAIVSVSAFFFMEDEDTLWYTHEFEEHAELVAKGAEERLKHSTESIGIMKDSWMLYQDRNHDAAFANVTYENFAVIGHDLVRTGLAQMIAVAPLVPGANRTMWEAYAIENQGWIASDLSLQPSSSSNNNNIFTTNPGEIPHRIYGYAVEANKETQLHLPIWQMYPTPQNATRSPIMYDLLAIDWFADLWQTSLDTRMPAVSTFQDVDFLIDYADYEREKTNSSPKFVIVEPIVGGHGTNDEVIAAAVSVVSWRDYLQKILEDEHPGIIVDIHHSCPTSSVLLTYSFMKTKGSVEYLGKNVDHGQWNIALKNVFHLFGPGIRQGPLDFLRDENCGYVVTVLGTYDFTEEWKRNDSYLIAFSAVAIFGFTTLVFFTYDYFVQRRNVTVTDTAARSTAIVSSLFPKKVAAQMMEEVEHGLNASKSFTVSEALTNSDRARPRRASSNETASKKAAPIADLFTDTTIMFADIAGFTKWSSTHEPSDVFTLLETIFHKFDEIADRRGVFKIETVGDCYVAVCGLPDPCPDHAVVMARFAWECMRAMRKIKETLEEKLGSDIRELDMRFGLHSGPVTAGVIRGERPRFQLFGDSMNKTSRIESSGQKGRVHISEEMAIILKASGKEHWLSKREDVQNLKGLGEVTTYWLSLD